MGFWDFIAPDYAGFKATINDWMPANVIMGPVILDRDNLTQLAWLNPASLAGIIGRVAYAFQGQSGATQADAWACCQALIDNINRGGALAPGPAIAGSDLTKGNAVAPLVIPNTYEITIRMICGGRAIDNVLFAFSTTAGQESTVANSALTAFKATSGPLSRLPAALNMVSVTAVDIRSTTGGQFTVFDSTAGGTTGTGIATRAASALFQYNGNLRSRSTRGRTYFGPLDRGWINTDGATLTTTAQTSILASWNQFVTAMNTAGFPLVVASRKLLTTTPISLVRLSPTVATQRHRLRA
jgi:hypothetical protein